MAGESNTKRVFPADIFAEDNDKSWSSPSSNVKNNSGGVNYTVLRKIAENDSDSSNSSEGDAVEDPNNVKIIERSFRKRKSSSNSEGNPEDASSSSCPATSVPHERVLPSMYDDDARSASPSAYEKKDLAYVSSFHKEFNPLPPKNPDSGPFTPFENKAQVPEKEITHTNSKDASLSPSRSSKSESKKPKSQSRSKSRERRPHRSHSRSHSRGRHPKSPVRDRRRSRSRDRHSERDRNHSSRSKRSYSRDSQQSRSHSRDYRRRSRSCSRDTRRSRSRGRDYRRSRSRSRDYRRSRSRSYDRRRNRYRSSSRDRRRHRRYSQSRSRSKDRSKARAGGAMTPQMALQQTMAAMSAKAEALTGVAFPKYYNPAAVNPLKYAEQVQKRKLLWKKDVVKVEEQPKNTVWDKLQFAQDQDGKMTAKFRKLMGIKSEGAPPEEEKESVLKKQEDLFRDLDQQYEMARVTTHTQRGVGLGYSAQALYPPVQK